MEDLEVLYKHISNCFGTNKMAHYFTKEKKTCQIQTLLKWLHSLKTKVLKDSSNFSFIREKSYWLLQYNFI